MPPSLTVSEAELLAQSWQLSLRAERKSPQTLKAYGDGVRQFLAWCAENDVPAMSRASLNQWVAGLLDGGAAASTARSRQLAVRRFSSWLADEGDLHEIPRLAAEPDLGLVVEAVSALTLGSEAILAMHEYREKARRDKAARSAAAHKPYAERRARQREAHERMNQLALESIDFSDLLIVRPTA